jgi:hypothetical protein
VRYLWRTSEEDAGVGFVSLKQDTMPKTYLVPGWSWLVIKEKTYFGTTLIRGADLSTFQPLNSWWAKDAKRVYCAGTAIRGADPETFQVLNELYAKDAQRAYTIQGPIREVTDPSTFIAFGPTDHPFNSANGYAKDANTVFHTTVGGKACVLKNADAASFIARGNGYGSDKTTMYFERRKIKDTDPAEWQYILGPYSRSGSIAYFNGEEIRGIDGEYLQPLPILRMPSYWCRDQRGYIDHLSGATNPAVYFEDFRKFFIFIGKVSKVELRWEHTSLDPTKADSWEKAQHAWVHVDGKEWLQRPALDAPGFPRQHEPFRFGEAFHLPLLASLDWMNEDRIWVFHVDKLDFGKPLQHGFFLMSLWWQYSAMSMRGIIEKTIHEAAR